MTLKAFLFSINITLKTGFGRKEKNFNVNVFRIGNLKLLVGVRGIEPPASASRRQHSTRLSYTPTVY
jgi:hypothetical protein